MKAESVKQMWQSFARAVLPAGAPDIQRVEMRRAFYAGCWCMLQGAANVADLTADADEASAQLQAWEDEMAAFQRGVMEGRA